MHHHLHLLLFGAAVTDYAHFDFKGRVFTDRETGFGGLEEGDAAHMRQFESGLSIDSVKDFFDGNEFGREIAENST
jgi:hypothetical protein